MKIAAVRKLYTLLLKRRNKAQREYRNSEDAGCGAYNYRRVRADAEVTTLDKVLDDLDRMIAKNHDRFHDQRKRL